MDRRARRLYGAAASTAWSTPPRVAVDSLGHIRIGCKERVRRAQRAGAKLQLVLGEIDRDDALAAGGNGTQKGCQSQPAQPDTATIRPAEPGTY